MSTTSLFFGMGAAATLIAASRLWGVWGAVMVIGMLAMALSLFRDLIKK